MKTKNQTLTEETSLLEKRQSKLADKERRHKREQNLFIESKSQFREEKIQFDEAKNSFRLDREKIEKDQSRLRDNRTSLNAERAELEDEKSEFKVTQLQIRENLLRLAKDYQSFSKQRKALDKERSQFKVELGHFTEEQARIAQEQNEISNLRDSLAAERIRFEDEQSQLEIEQKRLKEDQTRVCQELKDFDEKREDFDEQRGILQRDFDADRIHLARERIDLKTREAEFAETTGAFKTEQAEFASRQSQLKRDLKNLDDDLEKLLKELESLESAKQDLSQAKEVLETQRKTLRDETEEFKSLQNEWKQKTDSAAIVRDDHSESDDNSSGSDGLPFLRVLSSSTLSSYTGEVSDAERDAPVSSPAGLGTEAKISSEQSISIENTGHSLSISNDTEDLSPRSRKTQWVGHSNIDDAVLSSQIIEDSAHETALGNNEDVRSCDDAESKQKLVTGEILVPFDPDNPSVPSHSQDTDSPGFDLKTSQDEANRATRTSIAQHSTKQLRDKIFVKTLLSVVGLSIAAVLLSSGLWLNVSYKVTGIAAAVMAAVSILEVIRTTLLVHEMGTLKQESLYSSAQEAVIAEDVCEEYSLESKS